MKYNEHKINKYNTRISLIDYYITKNIIKLIKKDYTFIQNNDYLLGLNNSLGKNSLNILLDNAEFSTLIRLINNNIYLLGFKNGSEKNLLQSLVPFDEFYPLINDFLTSNTDPSFTETIISEYDTYNNNFIDYCIELIKLNQDSNSNSNSNSESNKLTSLYDILENIYNYDKEEIHQIITKLCKHITNPTTLLQIIKYINPTFHDIYPDENNNTCIDYLILNDNIETLDYLINHIDHIYFVNFEENSIFILLNNIENNTITNPHAKLITIIFKILSKSNISNMKDMYNNSILIKLLKIFKLEVAVIRQYIPYFDIFEQNTSGVSIYDIIIEKYDYREIFNNNKYYNDSVIKHKDLTLVNHKFSIKKFLTNTNSGIFSSDALHNMIYTLIILQQNIGIITIPNIKITDSEYINHQNYLQQSNNDKDILGLTKLYFHNFNDYLPHLIIWKDITNYYINSQLITWLQNNNSSRTRFIYIKLSIISSNKIQGNIRHANLLLIDNEKKNHRTI
ncbi:MAG: ankyrin repeat protein [Gaeavirus sp.]|uniref:Ankyrin repeat protein n=1 Tax=Gaeavirus sp. TaxID=2487767 RepID=A0A3G4ZZ32_9VIRU|nr:MAG: ankyrin repeat protein [Gaeavirus sp.]